MKPVLQRPKGVAIITALFIMTLVAIVATALSLSLQININRAQLVNSISKNYLASRKIISCQLQALVLMQKNQQISFSFKDEMPLSSDTQASRLIDLQRFFNLNNLIQKKHIYDFALLIQATNPKIKESVALEVSKNVHEWLKPQRQGNGLGTQLNQFYLKQSLQYLPTNRPFNSISELRLVKGVTSTLYENIRPFITALPKPTPININTASPEVLATLGSGLNQNAIKTIVKLRKTKPFIKLSDLKKVPYTEKSNISSSDISFTSNFFQSIVRIRTTDGWTVGYNTFQVSKRRHQIVIERLSQTFNTL